MFPLMVWSAGFTRTIDVVHPPPYAKWGMTTGSADTPAARSSTGNVVIKNSDLSFVNPRMAIAETGTEESKVHVPCTVAGAVDELPRNGASFRNRAIWPRGGIVKLPCPKLLPLVSVK